MSTTKERIAAFVTDSTGIAFLRSEFNPLGSRSSVNRALRQLVAEGTLVRMGYGAYCPGEEGLPAVDMDSAAMEVLVKLGADPEFGGRIWREWMEGRTLQVPAVPTIAVRKRRMTRKIGFRNLVYRYEYWGEDER